MQASLNYQWSYMEVKQDTMPHTFSCCHSKAFAASEHALLVAADALRPCNANKMPT